MRSLLCCWQQACLKQQQLLLRPVCAAMLRQAGLQAVGLVEEVRAEGMVDPALYLLIAMMLIHR